MNGTAFRGIANTTQSIGERAKKMLGMDLTNSNFAKVVATHPEAMTCDIINSNGIRNNNVPILARCGLIDKKVYGEIELPSVDSTVIIDFIGGRESFPFILGTLYPYSTNEYQSSQNPVNSTNKSFTKKILEKISDLVFRKIFKSGTSFEVKEDGTVILETPSGTSIQVDESAKKIIIQHKDGSKICTFTVDSNNGFIMKDNSNNEISSTSSGLQIKDTNNNIIAMGSTSVKINNNFEVLK